MTINICDRCKKQDIVVKASFRMFDLESFGLLAKQTFDVCSECYKQITTYLE